MTSNNNDNNDNNNNTAHGASSLLVVDVDEESAPVAIPATSLDSAAFTQKHYDLNGKGELDTVEFQMRQMDQDKAGHIPNDMVYKLLRENMETNNKLFNSQRIIMVLVGLVVLLTLSNFATAWAAAVLAREVKVDDSGNLVVAGGREDKAKVSTTEPTSKYNVAGRSCRYKCFGPHQCRWVGDCSKPGPGPGLRRGLHAASNETEAHRELETVDLNVTIILRTDALAMCNAAKNGETIEISQPDPNGTDCSFDNVIYRPYATNAWKAYPAGTNVTCDQTNVYVYQYEHITAGGLSMHRQWLFNCSEPGSDCPVTYYTDFKNETNACSAPALIAKELE